MAEVRVVTVEIGGQSYPIRSALDPTYVAELAAYVDQKMRAASDAAPASDALGVAILVALNIADELFRALAQQSSTSGVLSERALRLEQLLDDVLSQSDAPGGGNSRLGLSTS
jgi:cell division protein ZapA (FtsZ GTPase activity inhibitor)